MIDSTPISRTDLLHLLSASLLQWDSETAQSGTYMRIDRKWLEEELIPWILKNKKEPQGDGYRCIHFVHWLQEAITNAGYQARVKFSHACARMVCVLPSRESHAVGLVVTTDNRLYVLDPQDPKLVPLEDYPVLSRGRIRFL